MAEMKELAEQLVNLRIKDVKEFAYKFVVLSLINISEPTRQERI